jgi:hypothetical protein
MKQLRSLRPARLAPEDTPVRGLILSQPPIELCRRLPTETGLGEPRAKVVPPQSVLALSLGCWGEDGRLDARAPSHVSDCMFGSSAAFA